MQNEQAMSLAERLRRCVADTPFFIEVAGVSRPVSVNMTISLGVAHQASDELEALAQLMAEADQALYAAKHTGRNCVVAAESKAIYELGS
ncbi:diguanylate cyclase [Halomonas sp. PBN3]|uniref:diguanylate cyclase n=1 Tax=Halomonas sp. PBN3 TaxID=1397528 RepID=UPI0009DE5D9C